MFSGNTDDHFRLGIKVTKASVRLYVDFFGSDILVASPLGTCFGHSFQSAKRASRGFGFFFFVFFRFFARLFSRSSPVTKPSQPNQSYRLGVAELRVPYWPEARDRNDDDARDATRTSRRVSPSANATRLMN